MKKTFAILVFLYCSVKLCNAQDKIYESRGYIIDTKGHYVFQPCNDSSKDIVDCVNVGSFELPLFNHHGDVITPNDFNSMWRSAKRFYGRLIYSACDSSSNEIVDSFPYFYCRVKLRISENINNRLCFSEIISNGTVYKFNGLWADNSVIEFEPLRYEDRQNFIKYIDRERRGYKTW